MALELGALNQAQSIQALVGNSFANQINPSRQPSQQTQTTTTPEGDTVQISQAARDAAAQVNAPNRGAEMDDAINKFS